MLVSAAGLGLFRSTDHGERFEAIAPELLSDQVVFNSFYHPTTEPIVFSPTYGQDQTIFGLAEDRVYRSSDGGDSWTTIVLPVTTHDIDAPPPVPLLKSARPNITVAENDAGDTVTACGDSRILTPIGSLTVKRIAFAVVAVTARRRVLAVDPVARPRRGEPTPARAARVGSGSVSACSYSSGPCSSSPAETAAAPARVGRRVPTGSVRLGDVAMPPRERILGRVHAEKRAQLLVAVPRRDVHHQQVVTTDEVALDAFVVFEEQVAPALRFDLQEVPVVLRPPLGVPGCAGRGGDVNRSSRRPVESSG